MTHPTSLANNLERLISRVVGVRGVFQAHSQQNVLGVSALLFAASATVTIVWCSSMSAMDEMSMPGGWKMSMVWMRMPEQTWLGATTSFLAMWVVMMVAMMLPCLVPILWGYRQAVGTTGRARLGRLTVLVGVGYFFVWTMLGIAAFALGAGLAAVEMELPALAHADARGRWVRTLGIERHSVLHGGQTLRNRTVAV
jgi:predicted metal-binding membrane protein